MGDVDKIEANDGATGVLIRATVGEAIALAIDRHRAGHLAAAEVVYRDVLAVDGNQPDALHFLGVLRHQAGRGEAALELIRRAIAICPTYADAYNNLGNVCQTMGDLEQARRAYQRVIELNPNHAGAHNNLGVVLKDLGQSDAALAAYEKARALDPDNVDVYLNLGNTYRQQRQFLLAVQCFRKAIALKPYHAEAYRALAATLYVMKEYEEAKALLRQWLEFEPDNAHARHLLAAHTGEGIPERASDAYVRETFDGFALSYDKVLHGIDYRAPQLVAEALAMAVPSGSGPLAVLDAGCGTGLCARVLRPLAATLAGVDLSSGMLALARNRRLYDELSEAELTAYLADAVRTFDLIVSADTLVYFGRLDDVFAGAMASLRPGGAFVFTVERAPDEATPQSASPASAVLPDFRLGPHGRYSHSAAYIERALRNSGLSLERMVVAPLRKELHEEVAGLVVTARKPGAGDAPDATAPPEL